ncbi:hypothetical protein P280DRAFT_413823 [Massarina eburnea CBS 473.64]|uniref:F-box domain-containing protein n=1 Tax=Massarina eburnea CBS 473.64 TaxID=1395130 RepID=A0A6A6RGV4_9PLEO|nr:hypothetical protein P280DRAFT_413823 [Massarina eburnea CBS 473.64]
MFFDLPVELQRVCVHTLHVDALKEFRLVNKTALALATEVLFGTVSLMPSDESAEKFTNILHDETLSSFVRKVIFNTSHDPAAEDRKESDLLDSFADAMRSVGRFKNLKVVDLGFALNCAHEDGSVTGWEKEVAETVSFRTDVLETLLEGMDNDQTPATNVNHLVIKNLQDGTSPGIYNSAGFISVLGRLKRLHLNITTETDEASPEDEIMKPSLHRCFNRDLSERWLKPLQQQLTHLTIYCSTFWGFFPVCDLRGVHFPNLKSLSLGNWTIVHVWQIQWLLSHGRTLEAVILDDCPIVTVLKVNAEQKPKEWNLAVSSESPTSQIDIKEIGMRWHHVFPRFQLELPHLQHFALGQGGWKEGTQFEERYDLAPRLLKSRYQMFDCGIGPSHFFESGEAEKTTWLFPTCDDQDFEALISLLEVVQERWDAMI